MPQVRNMMTLNGPYGFHVHDKHRKDVDELLKNFNKPASVLAKLESKLGCRYSVLLKLRYFDPIRMTIIDPMHNFFMGTAKRVTKGIFVGTGLLDQASLNKVHQRLKSCILPLDIGRLPSRIDSGSTFTAEQWMNWTLYFSVYCLHGLLSNDQIECWRHFVLACRRLCKHSVTELDIKTADLLLVRFCKRTKHIYGSSWITPNMHMHCHISDCIHDFEPLHAFWLYSFERYNGLLGKQPTNNRSIEMQLIKRFLRDNFHLDLVSAAETMPLAADFSETVSDHAKMFQCVSETNIYDNDATLLPKKFTLFCIENEQIKLLRDAYSYLYPTNSVALLDERNQAPSICKRFDYIFLSGKKLSSASELNQSKVPYALATPIDDATHQESRLVHILYFIQHSWHVLDNQYTQIFAVCDWNQPHPDRELIGKPVEIWCRNCYEPGTLNCFVPVQNIVSRVIIASEKINDELVLIIIPLI